ncbi:UNKNOWN [Stylonychia lemnae]|uniref:Uncharacterized protein n=1 Tax=Stylonychia lemnae TaxID=5949 RepID=A0A077ZWY4_STYLE|nr:UNKNOWN [Stylonychia lemnae]|eukprot:CDW74106.1 UNKNOWN [Stylonychia lemnae]
MSFNKNKVLQQSVHSVKDLPPLSNRGSERELQNVNNDGLIQKLKLKLNKGGEIANQHSARGEEKPTRNNQQDNDQNLVNKNNQDYSQYSNPQQLKNTFKKQESNYLYNYLQQYGSKNTTQEYTNMTKQRNLSTEKLIYGCAKKFMIKQEYYDLKAVNSILFNQQARIVSVFKDYLIYDDICEFLTSMYTSDQSKVLFQQHMRKEKERLQKFKTISQTPNYNVLESKQILHKNLKFKQKAYHDKVKLQKLLQQEQIQRQLDAAAMKFNIAAGQTGTKKDIKNLQFQKLIQSSLVQEYNFTKQNISQNYDMSLSLSKYSIGKELNLSGVRQSGTNFNSNKNDQSKLAKLFKLDDSVIMIENQGLMSQRTNQGLMSQRTNQGLQTQRTLTLNDDFMPAGAYLKEMNPIMIKQQSHYQEPPRVRILPDIPKPNPTPRNETKDVDKIMPQNTLQPSQIQGNEEKSQQFQLRKYKTPSILSQHELTKQKTRIGDPSGNQDIQDYLDDDIDEIEKSQSLLKDGKFQDKQKANQHLKVGDQIQLHRRVDTEVDPFTQSYDSNDYNHFFADYQKKQTTEYNDYDQIQGRNSDYYQIYKNSIKKSTDDNNPLEFQRAPSSISNLHKPPRDHKYTQSVMNAQSEEEKKTYMSISSANSFKNQINFEKSHNILKLNLKPTIQEDSASNSKQIKSQQNKKFLQKLVFKNRKEQITIKTNDSSQNMIQSVNASPGPQQQDRKMAYLTPLNNQQVNFSVQFSPQTRNTMNQKLSNLSQSNPKLSIKNSPDNRITNVLSSQSSLNQIDSTNDKGYDPNYYSLKNSMIGSTIQKNSQNKLPENTKSSHLQQIPKIKIIKKPKIIFNQGPDFSRNSLVSQQSNYNQQQNQPYSHGSPEMKITQGRRMNRNEYINLKTRAHSYGGSGGGHQVQNPASTISNIQTPSIVHHSPKSPSVYQSQNSQFGVTQMIENPSSIMIHDQKESILHQSQSNKQNRQLIIKKAIKPQQLKFKVNAYKFVNRPQSNLDTYQQPPPI